MKLIVYITRHNRNINNILELIKEHNLDYIILDDSNDELVYDNTIYFGTKLGKERFYLKFQSIYDHFKETDYDGLVIIQDDLDNIDWTGLLKQIDIHKDKIIKLHRDSRSKCFDPREDEFYNNIFFKSYFFDCIGYFSRNNFLSLPRIIDCYNPRYGSSGVGRFYSVEINKRNIEILTPIISFCEHGYHESTMHRVERKLTPLKSTRNYHRPVIISVATFDNRNILPTLKSLLNQSIVPSKIYIYDNEQENNIDYNSNSKFYITKELPEDAILLTVDDDIIYDYYYIETMISYLSKNPWITIHGRKWLSYPIKSYRAADKMFAFNRDENYEGFIDVGGTGVSCFDLSKIDTTNLFDYIIQEDRMDDVMISIFLREQNIRPYHIPHKGLQSIQNKNTCYNTTTIYDTKHIELINKNFIKRQTKN